VHVAGSYALPAPSFRPTASFRSVYHPCRSQITFGASLTAVPSSHRLPRMYSVICPLWRRGDFDMSDLFRRLQAACRRAEPCVPCLGARTRNGCAENDGYGAARNLLCMTDFPLWTFQPLIDGRQTSKSRFHLFCRLIEMVSSLANRSASCGRTTRTHPVDQKIHDRTGDKPAIITDATG